MSEPALPPARHETKDVRFHYLAIGGALLIAAVVLFASVAYLIFPDSPLDRRYAGPVPDFARPRLQPSPRADMHAFYEKEMRQLNSTGWVDKQRGIVHIPIDQAMRLVAQQGIPDWPSSQPATGAPSIQNAPSAQNAAGAPLPPLVAPFANPPAPVLAPSPAPGASPEAAPPSPVPPPFANPPAPVPGPAPAAESKSAPP